MNANRFLIKLRIKTADDGNGECGRLVDFTASTGGRG